MTKTGLRQMAFFAGLIASWALLRNFAPWDPALFPGPGQVITALAAGIRDHSYLIATGASLQRLLVGYGLALLAGLPLGMLLARVKWLEDTLGTTVFGLQTLPSVCWLPLALLWFGLSDGAILFVTVMGSMPAITTSVRDGVKNVPPGYLRVARTLGARPLALYTRVLLPASTPALLTGARLGWSFAWRSLMAAELLFVGVGLGHSLMMGRELADMSQVVAVMIVIVLLGLFTDRLVFGAMDAQIRGRWGFGGPRGG